MSPRLQNDYYHFDTERQVLKGEHSNVQYRDGRFD